MQTVVRSRLASGSWNLENTKSTLYALYLRAWVYRGESVAQSQLDLWICGRTVMSASIKGDKKKHSWRFSHDYKCLNKRAMRLKSQDMAEFTISKRISTLIQSLITLTCLNHYHKFSLFYILISWAHIINPSLLKATVRCTWTLKNKQKQKPAKWFCAEDTKILPPDKLCGYPPKSSVQISIFMYLSIMLMPQQL